MKKINIIDLYKSILSTGGLKADKHGIISVSVGDTSLPYTVSGKSLVLPIKEQLTNPDWSNRIVFHPLNEHIVRGESLVLSKFRNCINTRANFTIGVLMQQLMSIATSPSTHSKLSPDQSELLSAIKDADEKTFIALKAVITAMSVDNTDRNFINIYLKKGGSINGVKYGRASIVSFPLYEELAKDIKTVYGVSMRIRDKQAIINLLEFMFPTINQSNSYSRGSVDQQAPSLDCVMKSVMCIASCVNEIINMYGSLIDDSEDYKYEDDWVDAFENLSLLQNEIRSIPMQAGNEGVVDNISPVSLGQPVTGLLTPTPFAPTVNTLPAPVPFHQPVSFNNSNTSGHRAGERIDFSSAVRSNPHLNAQFNHFAPHYGGNQQMPNQGPRWAQPQGFNGFAGQQINNYPNNNYYNSGI